MTAPQHPPDRTPDDLGVLGWAGRWYTYSFLINFLTYFPLALALLICTGTVTNAMLPEYGADKVVWHDEPHKQFFVGFSLSLVGALIFFVGYILWLRDRRERYLQVRFPDDLNFGSFFWATLGCFLVTVGGVGLVLVMMSTVVPANDEGAPPSPAEVAPPTTAVPLHLFAFALGVGLGCWLIWEKRVADRWWPARPAAPDTPTAPPLLKRLGYTLVAVLLLAGLFVVPGPYFVRWERGGTAPPWTDLFAWPVNTDLRPWEEAFFRNPASHVFYWPLVLGLLAGGLLLGVLARVTDWQPIKTSLSGCLKWLRDRLTQLVSSRGPGFTGRACLVLLGAVWTGLLCLGPLNKPATAFAAQMWVLAAVAAGLLLTLAARWEALAARVPRFALPAAGVVWLVFFGGTVWQLWPHLPPGQGWGLGFILVGLALTVLGFLHPTRTTFLLALLPNLAAAVALITYVPSYWGMNEGMLLWVYPLGPVVVVALVVLVVHICPVGARKFFAPEPTADRPVYPVEPLSPEDINRLLAAPALLAGWAFFVVLAFTDAMSPVPAVCALLFVLVALYGLAAYLLRGALAPILATLVVLAVLSGLNLYKFRFPDGLDRYEAGRGDKSPLYLKDLLEEDKKQISDASPKLASLVSALDLERRELLAVRELYQEWHKEQGKPPGDEERARARDQRSLALRYNLNFQMDKAKEAAKAVKDCRQEAQTAFAKLRAKNSILEYPYPSHLAEYLLDAPDTDHDFLLLPEEIRWVDYGGLGGGRSPLERTTVDPRTDKLIKKKPLLLISVSGGALRSAVWVHLILSRLELAFAAEGIDFPAHVRLITGASGGMLGAGHYVSALEEPGQRITKDRPKDLRKELTALRGDSITPLMKHLVFADLPNMFSPWVARHDRGQTLENTWEKKHGMANLGSSFAALRKGERQGWRPSLVFTPMMVEDGRRLVISNLSLHRALANEGKSLNLDRQELINALKRRKVSEEKAKALVEDVPWPWLNYVLKGLDDAEQRGDPWAKAPQPPLEKLLRDPQHSLQFPLGLNNTLYQNIYSIEGLELFRLFPHLLKNGEKPPFKVATAVRMSASFPFFTPAVSLPTWPRRRVVDAGYYDNYGVSLSAAWLFSQRNANWLDDHVSKVCIIQIRDGLSDAFRKLEKVRPDGSTYFSRALEELFSPLEGANVARDSSSSFRNDNQLELLSQFMAQKNRRRQLASDPGVAALQESFFNVVTFEYPGPAAMDWYLSEQEFKDLCRRADGPEVQHRVNHLLDFLGVEKRKWQPLNKAVQPCE